MIESHQNTSKDFFSAVFKLVWGRGGVVVSALDCRSDGFFRLAQPCARAS